jgi:hypothetical protein
LHHLRSSLNVADPEVRFSLLLTDRMIAVFSPGSALERKKAIALRDLVGLPLVMGET